VNKSLYATLRTPLTIPIPEQILSGQYWQNDWCGLKCKVIYADKEKVMVNLNCNFSASRGKTGSKQWDEFEIEYFLDKYSLIS